MLKNGILEDLGACIGATAALRLAGWQDGRPVYIPSVANPDHKLVTILAPADPAAGLQLLKRLVESFGGETICLPKVDEIDYMRRNGEIYRLLRQGVSVDCIAHKIGMSPQHIRAKRRWLEEHGLLPLIFHAPAPRAQLDLSFNPRAKLSPQAPQPQAPHTDRQPSPEPSTCPPPSKTSTTSTPPSGRASAWCGLPTGEPSNTAACKT